MIFPPFATDIAKMNYFHIWQVQKSCQQKLRTLKACKILNKQFDIVSEYEGDTVTRSNLNIWFGCTGRNVLTL